MFGEILGIQATPLEIIGQLEKTTFSELSNSSPQKEKVTKA